MTGKKGVLGLIDYYYPVVYMLLALALMIPLLPQEYYLALDMQFGPNSFSDSNFQEFYGDETSSYGGQLPLKAALAAVSDVLSVEITEKLLLFSILSLCGIMMHMSLPKELGIWRYFAGLLYMLNPFVFLRFLVGHWAILLSYAFFPLAISSFISFMKKTDDVGLLIHVAIMATLVSVSSHGAVLLVSCYALLFAIDLLSKKISISSIKRFLLLAILVLALNLYWIIPSFLSFGSAYDPASPTAYLEDFGAKGIGLPLYQSILTMHGFWRGGFIYTKDIFSLWFIPFIAISLLSIIGLAHLFRKDFGLSIFLAAIFIISFLLALGLNGPLAFLFSLPLLDTVLSFMFRDTQKFVWLIAFSFSVLGAYGAYSLSGLREKLNVPKVAKDSLLAVLLLASLAAPIIYNYGFFGFIGQAGTTIYPQEWKNAEAIMASDNISGNILILPLHLYMLYPWVNNTAKIIANPQSQFFSRPVIGSTSIDTRHITGDVSDPMTKSVSGLFGNDSSNISIAESLASMDIRYVFLVNGISDSAFYFKALRDPKKGYGMETAMAGQSMILFRNSLAVAQHEENGAIENPLFYVSFSLLLISLSIIFILVAGLPRALIPHVLAFSALLLALASLRIIGPHQMGFIIILSMALALLIRSGHAAKALHRASSLHL